MPAPPPDHAVVVDDLVVRYDDLVAVEGISFRADGGEILALLGPNGAGKTSTVEVLEGYRRPDGGQVRVLGLDPVDDHRAVVGRVGVMLQEGGVPTGMRPAEAIELYASYYDAPRDPRELLELVGLTGRARASWRNLSGGEQQRLSLALALVGRPTVAFLDEPTSGIDPAGRRLIRQVVADLRAEGVCVVLTTHDLDEAERLADRVVIIDRGQVLASGTPAELMAGDGADEILFGAPSGLDVAEMGRRLGDVEVTELAPGEYRAEVAPTPANVAAVTAWLAEHDLPLADLRAGRRRLEDVFLRLTEQGDAVEVQPRTRRGRRRSGS